MCISMVLDNNVHIAKQRPDGAYAGSLQMSSTYEIDRLEYRRTIHLATYDVEFTCALSYLGLPIPPVTFISVKFPSFLFHNKSMS